MVLWHSNCFYDSHRQSYVDIKANTIELEGFMALDGRLSITEIAKRLGVSTKTITRWEKASKIKQAKRDWRGWRVYSKEDLEQMQSFVETVY